MTIPPTRVSRQESATSMAPDIFAMSAKSVGHGVKQETPFASLPVSNRPMKYFTVKPTTAFSQVSRSAELPSRFASLDDKMIGCKPVN